VSLKEEENPEDPPLLARRNLNNNQFGGTLPSELGELTMLESL
jgi:hypothetical protein